MAGAGGIIDRLGTMHPIDDQSADRQIIIVQPSEKTVNLGKAAWFRRADKNETGVGCAQHLHDSSRPLLEAIEHAGEGQEEIRQISQHLVTGQFFEHLQEAIGRTANKVKTEPPGNAVGLDQQLHEGAVEQVEQPLRSIEKIERVLRRWSIHDQQIVSAILGELVDLLHRHEFP